MADEIRPDPEIEARLERTLTGLKGRASGFGKALWGSLAGNLKRSADSGCFLFNKEELVTAYLELSGVPASGLESFGDFWNPEFAGAMEGIFGPDGADRIRRICLMLFRAPYAHEVFRPSFRSARSGDYLAPFLAQPLKELFFRRYGLGLAEALRRGMHLEEPLALALSEGDGEAAALVDEALSGEASAALLSYSLVRAVVKSGAPAQVEALGRLLLAARAQEGVRQAILENADTGDAATHAYFIRLCIDNDLTRFSAVIRAMGTWSGLAMDNQRPALAARCFRLAHGFLSDEGLAQGALGSRDVLEIYMALWARACRDVHLAADDALELTEAPERYRRLAAWYFITHTAHDRLRHRAAALRLGARDPEELAWICQNLSRHSPVLYTSSVPPGGLADPGLPEDPAERRAQFSALLEAAAFIGGRRTVFEASVFPWSSVALDAEDVFSCALGLAGYDRDPGMLEELAPALPRMAPRCRRSYYGLLDPGDPAQRAVLMDALDDRSTENRKLAVAALGRAELTPAEVDRLSDSLATRSSGLRESLVALLAGLPAGLAAPAAGRLVNSKNPRKVLAGAELLDILGRSDPGIVTRHRPRLEELKAQERIPNDLAVILERFAPGGGGPGLTAENGFGLYDPGSPALDAGKFASGMREADVMARSELAGALLPDADAVARLARGLRDLFAGLKGTELEIEGYDGSRSTVLFGDGPVLPALPGGRGANRDRAGRGERGIRSYYFADEILRVVRDSGTDPVCVAKALALGADGTGYGYDLSDEARRVFAGLPVEHGAFDFEPHASPFHHAVRQALRAVLIEDPGPVFGFAMSAWRGLARLVPEEDILKPFRKAKPGMRVYGRGGDGAQDLMFNSGIMTEWLGHAHRGAADGGRFAEFWNELWLQYLKTGCRLGCWDRLGVEPLLRARGAGLIGDGELYFELLSGGSRERLVSELCSGEAAAEETFRKHPFLRERLARAVDRIVSVEERRGETPTPLTPAASAVRSFEGGSRHLAALVAALGKDGFHRGYRYWQGPTSKREVISRLIQACRPLPGETGRDLRYALDSAGIGRARLLEAVMYAPQWAEPAGEAYGVPGLASAVWLFHAHINEGFSAEKETWVAVYSPLSPLEFTDGAFDRDWFLEAYAGVGKEVFDGLYASARYITESGGAHRRSQLYADAVLGRLDRAALMEEIRGKRSQERLRALGLVPLDPSEPGDLAARYGFIQGFLAESRRFGAARQASEGRAARVALRNLALTAGFDDVDRMAWRLESEKADSLLGLTSPRPAGGGGYEARLVFGGDGTPEARVSKGGRDLKSVPRALARDPAVAGILESAKGLAEQKRRSRAAMEAAMVARTLFTAAEVARLAAHPVLGPLVTGLVFVSGPLTGFPEAAGDGLRLAAPDRPPAAVGGDAGLRLAHPHDLAGDGSWSAYQRHVYGIRLEQPFKQVFREYYPVTDDELAEGNVSRRYAGHQVQPVKAAAVLKGRGWTVDGYYGLQRVFHRDGLVARMYAMADWFSPADIEAPTLEAVRFFTRARGEPLDFKDVPPVVFSEVMRDVDLAVSVAHAGGVDPEASHSTVEMHLAVASELVAMLGVGNVTFKARHAIVKGRLGEYSVHMGSGTVHQAGRGMLAVLPVHSQARGRIFLPFADSDPRTAEIMSKILLFAEDFKIKDPAILGQISPVS